MHELKIPPQVVERVVQRAGRAHPFDVITPAKTAFVVVDMQNHFVKQGFPGEVPMARAIVPAINRLATALRELGEQCAARVGGDLRDRVAARAEAEAVERQRRVVLPVVRHGESSSCCSPQPRAETMAKKLNGR